VVSSAGLLSSSFMSSQDSGYRLLNLNSRAAWAEVWHLWTVIVPRRSITGRLVQGKVWRRYDGRRWIYKKLSLNAAEV